MPSAFFRRLPLACASLFCVAGLHATPVAINDAFSINEDSVLTVTAFSEIITDSFDGGSVTIGTSWTYLDTIENELGATHPYPQDSEARPWNHPDFNPATSSLAGWKTAPAPLQSGGIQAFPGGTPDTLLGINAAPDGERNLSTTYLFRNTFELTPAQVAAADTFTLIHLLDDGAAIYINGIEVTRTNLPEGELATTTFALGSIPDESTYTTTPVDLTGIVLPGLNTIAVELHQGDLASSDVGFDLRIGTASKFAYTDDPFGTDNPDFANGDTPPDAGFDGAAISVTAGGRPPFNSATSGGWRQDFTLTAETTVTLSFAYRLIQNENLEPSEYSEAIAAIDGVRFGDGEGGSLARFYGDGNGGDPNDTGWQTASFEFTLDAGQHTLTLGVFNNGTSQAQELATAFFDNIVLASAQAVGGVLANDTGSPESAALRSGTLKGSLAFSPDGTFTYTPAPDYEGIDVFTYVASNASGDSSPATVVITVLPQNDPPDTVADVYPATEDLPLTVPPATGILANDSDIDSPNLTVTDISYQGIGSLVVSADGSFTYTPAPEFSGTDTFTYLANDGSLNSVPTTVSIDVAFVDDTPAANADTFATSPATTLVVDSPALSLVANDTDPENQTLSALDPTTPTSGALDLNPDGTFTYTPALGFSGTATFTYRASDSNTLSDPATVTINVNTRPLARPNTYTVQEDQILEVPALFNLLRNDSDVEDDPLTAAVVTPPAHGVLLLNPGGTFAYQPDPDFSGTDSFTYIARDAFQSSSPTLATINVAPVNDPPEARPDTFKVLQDSDLTVPSPTGLLANDTDPDSLSLTVSLASPPAQGFLDLNPDGSFTYTPGPAFTGPVTFTYVATDGALTSPPVAVEIDVTSPSDNIVINEIMYHPGSGSDADEFIELHNTGGVSVDLSSWSFTSGISLTFPPITIPPGGYVVASADPDAFAATYPDSTAVVVGPWIGRLSNSGERIRLKDASGTEIDDLTYADQGTWANRRTARDGGEDGWVWRADHDGNGSSLELINPKFSNKRPGNWTSSDGSPTPGARNTSARDDIAPIISNVAHHPPVPLPSDPVTITADLDDDNPAHLSATLHYRLSIAASDPVPFTTLPMTGDLDNRFTAQVPPLPDGTVVEFYVSATDGISSRSYPGPSDSRGNHDANLLYQVDTERWTGEQPIYRLIIRPADREVFVEDGSGDTWNNSSNAQINATFITTQGTDTTVRYQCGVRRRGAGSRGRLPHNWRVAIPRDDPWNGVSRLNLNTQFTFLQFIGNKLAQAAGLASADLRPVSVRMNGTDHAADANSNGRYGLYVHAEVVDSDFAASHFPHDPQGNIYRARRPDAQWAYRNGNFDRYAEDGWAKQTNASQNDWSDLDNLLRVVNQASGPTYVDQLGEVADIDQWVRWFAFMALVNSRETNLSNGTDDDYYMYRGTIDSRFVLVPHDFDTILGQGDTSADPDSPIFQPITDFGGRVMQQFFPFFQNPDIAARYYIALLELAQTIFAPSHFDPFLDNCLAGWVPQDRVEELKQFMAERRSYVLSQIPTAITADSSLDTQDGYPRTSSPLQIEIGGRIDPINTRRVLVNGIETRFDPFSATWSSSSGTQNVLPFGSTWSYLDDGSDQGTAWRNRIFLPAILWEQGAAPLGYGDDGEATQVGFGEDDQQKYATTYFRTFFQVPDPSRFFSYELTVRYDDGFAAYLNGEEIARENLDDNAPFDAYTPESREDQITIPIDSADIRPGQNTLAIEVHQASAASSDIQLDARLRAAAIVDYGLVPGLNKIAVTALGENDIHLGTTTVDVWVDTGNPAPLSGTLTADTTLTAVSGPHKISGNLVVPDGITLTIAPGTSVYFADGARIIVRGKLVADGTATARIQLTQEPADSGGWDGIRFQSTSEDNSLRHVDLHAASGSDRAIGVAGSKLVLDDVSWSGTGDILIDSNSPQLTVTNCRFPATEGFPAIRNNGLSGSGYFVLESCDFSRPTTTTPVIEFTGGGLPGPVFQAYNNRFRGAFTHAVVLTGSDAYLEGNTFTTILSGDPDLNPVPAAAIATTPGCSVTVVRNTFHNLDHAISLAGDSTADFTHNTVTGVAFSAIIFDAPTSGSAAVIRNSVFEPGVVLVENPTPVVTFALTDSIIDASYHVLGTGNIDIDPVLAPSLLETRGATTLPGAKLSPPPPALTSLENATIHVSGPGISTYRHSLDGAPFGPETPVSTPITLTDLPGGSHSLSVIGKNAAGRWAQIPAVTPAWSVDASLSRILINEVLASNSTAFEHEGTFPDYIELWNDSSTSADISGYSLSDDPSAPTKFTFPAGTSIPARGYLVVFANTADGTSGFHTGFGLDADGDTLTLSSPAGTAADSLTFGPQATDISLGRAGHDQSWTATSPTPAAPNIDLPLGSQPTLRINEWLASNRIVARDDFLELFNPSPFPTSLHGLALTDDPVNLPARSAFPPHSFIPGGGFLTLRAGSDLLPFNLSKDYGAIAITDGSTPIDRVHYVSQRDDISEGRITDGSPTLTFFPLPTPGLSNSTDLTAQAALVSSLRITEIMFNPPGGSSAEFVELHNTGTGLLDLTGVRLTGGITFDFAPGTTIPPGGFLVVVADPATFTGIYGTDMSFTGPFTGKLNNAGEDLRLEITGLRAGILDFDYDDDWYPTTDGGGRSLTIADATQPRILWDEKQGWRPGGIDLGTPGSAELVSVTASAPRTISLPGTATLTASPLPAEATLVWSRISGPGLVSFDDPSSATPNATVTTPGRYLIQVTASSAGATTSTTVELEVLDSYASWTARNLPGVPPAFAAPEFDLDTDGLPNLLEYTLGLSPIFPDTHPFSQLTHNAGSLSLTYRQPYLDQSELSLAFQASPDLANWSPANVTSTVVADDGRTRTVRATIIVPDDGTPETHFLRSITTLR